MPALQKKQTPAVAICSKWLGLDVSVKHLLPWQWQHFHDNWGLGSWWLWIYSSYDCIICLLKFLVFILNYRTSIAFEVGLCRLCKRRCRLLKPKLLVQIVQAIHDLRGDVGQIHRLHAIAAQAFPYWCVRAKRRVAGWVAGVAGRICLILSQWIPETSLLSHDYHLPLSTSKPITMKNHDSQ